MTNTKSLWEELKGMVMFFINHWGGDLEQAKEDMKALTNFRPECQFGSAHWQQFALS